MTQLNKKISKEDEGHRVILELNKKKTANTYDKTNEKSLRIE